MPYKKIEDRREAWRRWAEKNRKPGTSSWMKKKAREIATWAHVKRDVCSIAECKNDGERHHPDYSKAREIVWLCKLHHELEHHPNFCVLCGDKHRARGYCNKHWKQWRKGTLD